MRRTLILCLLVLAAPLSAQTAAGCKAFSVSRTVTGDSFDFTTKGRCALLVKAVDSTALKATRDTLTTVRAALQLAKDSLAKWPSSSVPAPTPVPVDTTPTPPPPVTGAAYPNRPATYTRVLTNYPFTEAPPTTGVDTCPMGTQGWCMIGGGPEAVQRITDATAPTGDKTVWEQAYRPGDGGGNAAGNIYFDKPTNTASKLYASVWVWYSPGFEWNQISQKLLYWEDGNILLQQNHNTNNPLSMYIGAYDVTYDINKCPNPGLTSFEGKWHQIEWQVERGNSGLLRVWLDGKLCSDYRVQVPAVSGWWQFNVNSTWGGGGTRTRTSYRRVDHVFLATTP